MCGMLSGDLLICASSHVAFYVTMVTSLEYLRRLHFCYIGVISKLNHMLNSDIDGL